MRKHLLCLAAAALLAAGCGSSDGFVVTGNNFITGGGNSTANDDNYTTFGNAQIAVNAQDGVLANDVISGDVVASNTEPANGTAVVNADGSFTYTPNTGFRGTTDSFNYTLTNGSTASVNISLPTVAWFVDNTGSAGSDGSLVNPFTTIAEAQAISQPGDIIFLFAGNGGAYGPIVLKDNQRLVGEASGLVAAQTLVPPPAGRPVITNPSGDGVTLANGNVIEGVEISETSGAGIFGENISGLTIQNVICRDTGEESVWVEELAGTFNFSDSEFRNSGFDNIFLPDCTGTGTMSSITCIGADDDNLDVETFSGTLSISDSSFSGSIDDSLDFYELSGTVTMSRLTLASPAENCLQVLDAEGGTVSISDSILASPGFQGVCSEHEGSGTSVNLSIVNCTIYRAFGEAIYFYAEDSADCNVTISGNQIADAGTEFEDTAVDLGFENTDARLLILDNVITLDENDYSAEGLFIYLEDGSTVDCLVDNNRFEDLDNEGMGARVEDSTLNIGVTNNVFNNNNDDSTLTSFGSTAVICLRYNNNTVTNEDNFELQARADGTINAEAFVGNTADPDTEGGGTFNLGLTAGSCVDIPTR